MATHFSISAIQVDDNTLSRSASVRVGTSGDVKFKTPLKVGMYGVIELPLYEAHRRISPNLILNCLKSEDKDRATGRDLKKRCKGKFNILNVEYDHKEIVPTERMIVALSDMQYNNTDVIATPSWFDLITKKNYVDTDLYLGLSKTFIEAASTRNHKPIMGTIPQSIPPEDLEKVIQFFIDSDITSFIVDSHGRTLISGSWIRAFQRSLDRYDIEKECLLYTLNAYQGMVRKVESGIEAKDFIGFTAGFDIIGGKHSTKFSSQPEDYDSVRVGRVFKKDTYTYEKRICSATDKQLIDEQTIRDQNAELQNVREVIADGQVKDLLEHKLLSHETLSTIFSFKDDRYSTRLDDFI